MADGLRVGGSVAVNGCCLTAVDVAGGDVRFDLVRETLDNTNLGGLDAGSGVNVERSFRVGDEVGGHILSGHIASTVSVTAVLTEPGHRRLAAKVPDPWMRYLTDKGFVALNGASLTIADVDHDNGTITVSLIPETLERTNFAEVDVGHRLNLEVDARTQAVVDTVQRMLPELVHRQTER